MTDTISTDQSRVDELNVELQVASGDSDTDNITNTVNSNFSVETGFASASSGAVSISSLIIKIAAYDRELLITTHESLATLDAAIANEVLAAI
jgi:hypothetical protein